jgi:hypothetical protein
MVDQVILKNIKKKYAYSDKLYDRGPEPENFTCQHCGETFVPTRANGSARQKLRIHLRWCENRILLRHLKYNDFIFVLSLNPIKTLSNTITEFSRYKDTREIPQLLIGALQFLKMAKKIKNFAPFEVKNSPDFSKILDNGITPYKTIRATLSPEDRDRFGSFANEVFSHRFDKEG